MNPSDVVYAIPTANPEQCGRTFARWRERGYRTAALVDGDTPEPDNCDLCIRFPEYGGYGWAVNRLCEALPEPDWLVTGGDDTEPDPIHAPGDIALQCLAHFGGTFGVMQPTGDPWMDHCIRKFAGSPWMGREYRRRANMGHGPYWEAYRHYYDDTELQFVAIRAGVFWQRPDLVQAHHHWTRTTGERPAYLDKVATREPLSRQLFSERQRAKFPGSGFLR